MWAVVSKKMMLYQFLEMGSRSLMRGEITWVLLSEVLEKKQAWRFAASCRVRAQLRPAGTSGDALAQSLLQHRRLPRPPVWSCGDRL